MTAFRMGVLAGLVIAACCWLALYLMLRDPAPAPYTFEGSTSGADLSRHGARTVEIRTPFGQLARQTCNGACDDLSYKVDQSSGDVAIWVRDAAGQCLLCEGAYVDRQLGSVATLHVGGGDKLNATLTYRRRAPDGAWSSVGKP